MYFKHYEDSLQFEIMIRILKAFFSNDFNDSIDHIPQEMRPRRGDVSRCCVYRDRAIIKYRCMATLGFSIEDEINELQPLSDYAELALTRQTVQGNMITFLDEACNGCVKSQYLATSACKMCLVKACAQACPKDAVYFENHKSHIDGQKCIKCGLCMKACPYHAIVFIPIPCEEVCPTGAISRNDSGRQEIDYQKCIFCGKCMTACPFTAVLEKSQIIDVLQEIERGEKLVAMLAPAIAGDFTASMKQLVSALKELGFHDVIEVAVGADKTATLEAEEFIERMEKGAPFMTSSCCPAYTELVRKHIPELNDYVSDTHTPLHYSAELVKRKADILKTVFLGPCVAKRKEGNSDPLVDYVMTFQELKALFAAKEIDVDSCPEGEFMLKGSREGRSFPVSGGVTAGIKSAIAERADIIKPAFINGLTAKTCKELKRFATKGAPGNFVEVMGCEGGCVAGPAATTNPKKAGRKCQKYADESKSLHDKG